MPNVVNTDIGQITFPDDYSPEKIVGILNERLPAWREGLKRGTASDIGTRLLYEPAMALAGEAKALTRGAQNISDFFRRRSFEAQLPEPTSPPEASENERRAEAFAKRLEATKEERLREESPVFQTAESVEQKARETFTPNPTRETALPTTAIRGVSRVIPKLAEAAALTTVAAPVAAAVAPAMMATRVGGMVPAMLSAGAAFGVTPEGGFSPTEAAIAAGTVPVFGAGEALATKLIEKLPIRSVRFELSPNASQTLREAQSLGRTIEQAPEGFAANVQQKLGGLPLGELGRKAIEQTGGILAANAYLGAVQAPGILRLPEEQRGPAIADLITSSVAMSLLGYLPLLNGRPSTASREIWNQIAKEVKTKYGAEPSSEPPAPAAGLPEPPPKGGPAGPSEFAAPVQPSAEQLAAEEAAAAAEIARRANQPEPTPAPVAPQSAPKRRSIAPAEERPRFRPPIPVPTVTPVPETVTPVTPPTPPLPGPPEATTPVVPEATQKGVAPLDISDAAYDRIQKQIDSFEDKLAASGVDVIHLYDPAHHASKLLDPNVWKPMPAELATLYRQRDQIGAGQMDQSVAELKTRLKAVGLSDSEINHVLDSYHISPTDRSAAAQNLAIQSAPNKAGTDRNRQAEDIAIILGIQRGEQIDDVSDLKRFDRKTLEDAAKATSTIIDYFHPKPTEKPNAIPVGSTAQIPLGQGTQGGEEVGGQIRKPEKPPVPQTKAETPQAPGTVEPEKKAAEEQFESDLVVKSRDIVRQSSNPDQAYDQLVKLYADMPRLGTRTAQSKTAQAYSTPPPLAFLASHLAGVNQTTVGPIGEPTAGNGMLLIGTGPNATILANELDPNRNARLIKNFPGSNYSMLDATSQDFFDYLSQWGPKHLIMNPPFGGRVEEGGQGNQRFPLINAATAKTDTPSIDLAIALNSLEAMAPDGRAVIIIGSKTGTMGPQFSPNDANRAKDYNRPEMLEFFQRFNVTDWFTVGGKLYEKMGAGWPVDVIVINGKRGTLPTAQGGFPRPWVKPPKVYNSWADLKEKLYETPSASQPQPEPAPSAEPSPRPPARPQPAGEPSGSTGGAGSPPLPRPGSEGGRRPAGGTTGVPQEPRTPAGPSDANRPPKQTEPKPPPGRPAVIPPNSPEPAPAGPEVPKPAGGEEEAGRSSVPLGEGSTLLNVPFRPVSKLGGANLVAPKNVADAMYRAVTQLEQEVGMPVDDYVAKKLGWTKEQTAKRFSSAQAEAVALFIRNNELRGTGLINSDQTGVGKGRSVAGVIHYALKNGKIPIFITAKKQLYSDMAGRDLPAVGIDNFLPFITDADADWTNGKGEEIEQKVTAGQQRDAMNEITKTGKLPKGVHGIFTTYEQLKGDKPRGWKESAKDKRKRKKNFQAAPDGVRFAMLRKLAPNAIFILDEAHQAAGQDSDSGLSLQSVLPSAAGVYYASATFAKRPDNLSLYSIGTSMSKAKLSRKELAEAFEAGGVPLQQALTSMLTESGEFVRREQNMEGVDFKFEATGTDPEKEAELADTYTSYLRDLFKLSEQTNAAAAAYIDDENQVRPEGEEVDLSSVQFGSRLFNLSTQYLFSLRTDATIQKALQALKNGQKPFIAVYNTMAGPIADLHKRGLPINYSGMLEREMQKMLEITINDPNAPADPANKLPKGKRRIILEPEDLPDGGRFYYKLQDQIHSTDFSAMPISPIDTIKNAIKKAGYTIGELTGRQGEVEETNEGVKFSPREKLERNKILGQFNKDPRYWSEGDPGLDALIVNSSADTGVSAHTDPKFKDQRQRHMIIAQSNPDINGFMQIVGRVMRFGQTKLPTYTIISSSLAPERRFNVMLRAKLNSLNANTTADTESGITQSGLTADIFNPIGDVVVANVMAQNPELADLARISLPDPTQPGSLEDYARYATGYFVLLPNSDAEHLWREIADTYAATIKSLDDAGENPLKAQVVDLRAKTEKSQTIQEGTGKTLFDGPVVLETANVKPPQPALTADQAEELASQGRGAAEQKARNWLSKFEAVRSKRLDTMRQRESTEAQIAATDEIFQRTRDAVQEAVRYLGEPVAVMSASGEGVDFYGIPIGLMLKSENIGDFSGPSKHSLVLATNGLRRQVTLPLSQLERLEPSTREAFDSGRDTSGKRHLVTGNLLRGVTDAKKMAGQTARPKVAIYSTSEGQVKTGVLMAPNWNPATGLRALGTVIKNPAEMKAAMNTHKLITAGPVLIRGRSFSVPSRSEFKAIWSDPKFAQLFDKSPVERRGEFAGEMNYNGYNTVFDFLKSKGITPTLQTTEEGGKLSVTLGEAPETGVTAQDIQNAFPAEQGFVVKPVRLILNGEEPSAGFLVKLPNGEIVLIDPNKEEILFDPEKAAADWGISVDDIGTAAAKYTAGGVTINDLQKADLIELLKTSGPGSLSHEKFHFLFNMALTPQERAAILKRYTTEEKAAEAFRRSEGFTRSFWDKIKRFLEWLANLFRGDAFKKMRQKLSTEPSTPERRGGEKLSLEAEMRNPRRFEERLAKPITTSEEAVSLKRQAGAGAGLVPDEIAGEIRALNPADPVEKRVADKLDFVLKLHGVAEAQKLKAILDDPTIQEHDKQAAISNVLRQIEHVRIQADDIEEEFNQANRKLGTLMKNSGQITAKELVEGNAKQIAENLVKGYRAYLTAQAANLPADQNIAAARSDLIRRMRGLVDDEAKYPDILGKAITKIAEHAGELPIDQGAQAVADAIREKGILRNTVGDDTINFLTSEKVGGFPPLLADPRALEMLSGLADLQKKSDRYAKQIEVVEQAFRGKGEPTPVELKKFAETYRKFRNKQADAAKAVSEMSTALKEADQDVQVYGRSHDLLTRLQNEPQFRNQLEAILREPGAIIFNDIARSDPDTHEIIYKSPLKTEDEEGNTVQHEFKIPLAPDEEHDRQAISNMADLIREVDEFLQQPNIDPIERRTWELRKQYIQSFLFTPSFEVNTPGMTFHTKMGTFNLDPFNLASRLIGAGARGPRTVLESMSTRAAFDVNRQMLAGQSADNGYRLIKNNREFGDAITTLEVLAAVKSHGWPKSRTVYWTQHVLNPLLAANQAAGQMKLKAGDYIPGTGIKITPQDYAAAQVQKKFSRAIVQTTQGTAKGAPVLVHNPILNEQQFAGRAAKRAALSPGPFTMARQFSDNGQMFANDWVKANTPEQKLRLMREGLGFKTAVLSYVTTTNPEFEKNSPLIPVYEEYTANSKREGDQVNTLDQLVDRLAPIAVHRGLFETEEEAKEKIPNLILSEVSSYMGPYVNGLREANMKPEFTSPESIGQYASATNAFTRARQQMVAPDAFYNYSLTTAPERTRFVGSGYQMFQLNQIAAFKRLQKSLELEEARLNGQIKELEDKGMSPREATRIVEERTAEQLGQKRFRFSELEDQIRTIEKMLKSLQEIVIDARDKNDSAAIWALSRFRSTISSTLLAGIGPVLNNTLGGVLASQHITSANLGRAHIALNPLRSGAHAVNALMKKFLMAYPIRTPIGAIARSNIPLAKEAARLAHKMILEAINAEVQSETWGLRNNPDVRNRIKAQSELKTSAGQIEEKPVPAIEAIPNWIESLRGLNWFLNHLRAKSPGAVDNLINMAALNAQRSGLFEQLKRNAVKAFAAREAHSAATGVPLSQINDFSKRSGILSPEELGLGKANGFRNANRMRIAFQPVGILDKVLLDYYNRYKAAPESEKSSVPLFANAEDEGAILYNLATYGNVATAGFTPPAMVGVGKRGLLKNIIFMFRNYPFRMAEQMSKLFEENLRDPKAARKAYNLWAMFGAFLIIGLAGALGIELRKPLEKAITGRTTAALSLSNVQDAGTAARYVGMALANNVPYYGQVISQMLGNPGYGSWWDVSQIVPLFGLAKDLSTTINRIGQTHDVLFPLADFAARWAPPTAPLMRLVPSLAGDIEARNAARALRVVGPSEGIELAGGGGQQASQTPASAAIRRLISAAYRGDEAGIQEAFKQAVEEKRAQGSPDPERAVLQSLASKEPARVAYGRAITPEEESRLIGRMSGRQRADYEGSRDAFNLINQTLGTKFRLTSTPQARTRGQASRRSIFAQAQTPIFPRGSRRRALGGRRRRAFGHLSIRGTSTRRKRRSPARFSFAA